MASGLPRRLSGNPPATQEMQETRARFLGREDLLEEEMATHSSIFTMEKSHGQRSLAGYRP